MGEELENWNLCFEEGGLNISVVMRINREKDNQGRRYSDRLNK